MKAFFVVITATLMLLSFRAKADDMQKYLADTQKMVRQGKYEEALKRHIWFHNHALEHERSMYGVRLSFALSYWKSLGEAYPPAKKALIEIRDRKTRQIENGKGNFPLFHDVASINRTLKEGNKTIKLFEYLDKKNPELAKKCWTIAKKVVITAKRFDLAKKYMGNLLQEFTREKTRYDMNIKLYNNPQMGGEHFKRYNKNHFVKEILRLIEVAVALGDEKASKEIQKKALALIDDKRIRDAVTSKK